MKNKSIILLCTFFISGIQLIKGQEVISNNDTWTLKKCIDYAVEHNIDIQQIKNTSQQVKVDVSKAKWARLPNLKGDASQTYNFGKNLSTDKYSNNANNRSTRFSLSTNIPVFTGLRLPNEYKLSVLNFKASIEDLNKAKEDMAINITQAYLQVLVNMELSEVAVEQLEISKEQLFRVSEAFKTGKLAPSDLTEAEARVEQDKMNLTKIESEYKISLLKLSQLLELPSPDHLRLQNPKGIDFKALSPIDEIYMEALMNKPQIKAAEYRVKGAKKNIRIAQSGFYPEISLNGGVGTNYYKIRNEDAKSFGSQLNDNLNEQISINVSIPIFNRLNTINSVKKAKLQRIYKELELDKTRKVLYKEIQQAWYNAVNAESEYKSSLSTANANEKTFVLMREKFNSGQITSVEYNESKFNYMKALSEKIQAKYNYIFSTKIIDFYKGIPIE